MVKHTFGSDQTIIRYLLNELSADDQARFEETYFSDGSLFEQVRALEEEMIEEYAKGGLPRRERRLFERHYLASEERRARIDAARQLVEMCSLKAPARTAAEDRIRSNVFSTRSHLGLLVNPRLTPVFGVSMALLLLLGAVLTIELLRLRGRLAAVSEEHAAIGRQAEESERRLVLEREQLTEERKRSVELRESLENLTSQLDLLKHERARSQSPENQIVFLALTPGVRSLNKPDRAVISARTNSVALRVELEAQEAANLRSYRAIVKTVDGDREIWMQEGIKPQRRKSARYVVVRVPAYSFKAAGARDFTLTLGARTDGGKDYDEIESYYFQVIAR